MTDDRAVPPRGDSPQPSSPAAGVPPELPAPRQRSRLRTVKVRALAEDFRIVQLQGNLFVCSPRHGNCCCGWTDKDRAPLNQALYESEWERRKLRNKLHLSFTGCLGPCAVGNNALLLLLGRPIWFKDLNDDALIPAIYDYVEAMLVAGRILRPPAVLQDHLYERYLPPVSDGHELLVEATEDDGAGLERLDPVCLMDVDPATARHRLEYNGRTYYFCAPSCKRDFEREPQAYEVV
jgi:YHS domain-containing protein